ncbi:hypothetical protein LINPERPRIM_LOCUS27874 [Linum perenne]
MFMSAKSRYWLREVDSSVTKRDIVSLLFL